MTNPVGIFITSDEDTVTRYFFGSTRARSINSMGSVDPSKVMLITPSNNKYLRSFEYAFSPGTGADKALRLDFVDIDGKFEEFFFDKSPIKSMLTTVLEKALRAKNPDAVTDLFSSKLLSAPKIFFAFGVGEDLDNWSAPLAAELASAETEISSEGLRSIVYYFTIVNSPILTPVFDVTQTKPNKFSYQYFTDGNIEAFSRMEVDELKLSGTINSILKKLLLSYLRITGNTQNPVVLLPDLEDKFWAAVQKRINDHFPVVKVVDPANTIFAGDADVFSVASNAIGDVFGSLGINYGPSRKGSEYFIPEKENTAYGSGTTDLILEKSKAKKFTLDRTLVFGVDTKETQDTFPNKSNIPEYYLPIVKFEEGVRALMGEGYAGDFMMVTENNLKVLDIWERKKLIKNRYAPALLYGERQTIIDYMYLSFSAGRDLVGILGSTSNIKISTEDALIYDKKYRVEMINALFRKKSNSSFGEQIPLDDLAYVNKDLLDANKLVDIPLFTHNTSNPNVLSLKLNDTGNMYRNALDHAIGEDNAKYLAEVLDSVLFTKEEMKDLDNFIATSKIQSELNSKALLKMSVDMKLIPVSTLNSSIDLANNSQFQWIMGLEKSVLFDGVKDRLSKLNKFNSGNINALTEVIILWNKARNVPKEKIFLRPGFGKSSLSFQNRLFKHIFQGSFLINLKTLPFFHLCGADTMNLKPAMLISKRIRLTGTPSDTSIYDFTSGMYSILGFRHVISSTEAYSEFTLQKSFANSSDRADAEFMVSK